MTPLLRWQFILLFRIITWIISPCLGQEVEKIQTERPGQTESSSVIPKGTLQLETGYQFQKATEEGLSIKTNAYPTALVRLGLLNWLELRIQSALRDSIVENGVARKVRGLAPLNVGVKFHLWQEQGWRPEAALIARAALPVGSEAYRPDNPEPELRLTFSNKLTEKIEAAYNLTFGWPGEDQSKGYTFSLSGEVHDKLKVFGEVFGNKVTGEQAEHQADAGILFLLLPNLQLDLAAGTGLSKAAPDYFITTGISVRLPR
ncbi:transporter [Pontibacter ruber]|uniref:Transporter n=1 Tax=Pontibacter ruber TaxID=1343895 RepID=A0ABW5CTE4_9BACT|nr:transporter [Pontibacter ruber]